MTLNEMFKNNVFITDLGTDVSSPRYAVWCPEENTDSHSIAEVGDDLDILLKKYNASPDCVCLAEQVDFQSEKTESKNEMKGAEKFQGLPMMTLIAQPMYEVAKGQSELCTAYFSSISKIAFAKTADNGDENIKNNVVRFSVTSPADNSNSSKASKNRVTLEVPLVSLVPIPTLEIQNKKVDFNTKSDHDKDK